MAAITNDKKLNLERNSNLLVILVTILALLIGVWVKNSFEDQPRHVEFDSISADVPNGWIVQGGVGDLVFSATKLARNQKYFVRLVSSSPNDNIEGAASTLNQARGLTLDFFRVLEETSVAVDGREGYRVTYAYVDEREQDTPPLVMKGIDYYFTQGEKILIITFTSPIDSYEEGLSLFTQFRDSVSGISGE